MSAHSLVQQLSHFKGRKIIDAIDEIEKIAQPRGYSVNVIDPMFNTHSIDEDPRRLNVRTDNDFRIVSFTIG